MKKSIKIKSTQSSVKWLSRNAKDKFSKLAKQNNYRSRAAYKLDGINQKYKILKGAKIVLDIGSAPGSWLQYVKRNTNSKTKVIGVDLKKIMAIQDVITFESDFISKELWDELSATMQNNQCNVILSDMAPNTSGTRSLNHINIMNLAESVFDFSQQFLAKNGHMIIKLFEGNKNKEFYNKLRKHFKNVHFFKPEASYKDSSEIFIVGLFRI
ncbi:RlmE family RNA methyltransferase [Rickettsiales endosymbiont of Trichoplax sp. H2]|uniref:RlmE family RNA methyltransferase n=1 Tax=Rickettsiales endosymbiont of Trichoplax sp. H2 TaxID=2021221 RepID=UPI0012B210C8|nr:RlmE family RNA methyltransferase [Rickettsiales endosymbiont of Trichoplax sp. H2]MSO13967.1 Ribosomal RNA large subunit methyltransferase E [Rickettsiales endosymbiont of Trichoplax sp. H2]